MHTLFVILNYLSVLTMLVCTVIVATHRSSRMQKLALLECVSLLFCCIGFLFRVEAKDASTLIAGQKLVYATVTHSMFLMLLFILDYCRMELPMWIRLICHGLNLLISIAVLTLDHHTLFYRSYWAVDQGDYAILDKEYGPLHTLAVGLFALYMGAAVVVAILFSVKNMKTRMHYVRLLLLAVAMPCLAYIIPKLTNMNNDLQPIAFAAFTMVLLMMVYRAKLYDINNIAAAYSIRSMKDGLIVLDPDCHFMGCNKVAADFFPVLKALNLDADLKKESEELKHFIEQDVCEYRNDGEIFDVSLRPIKGKGNEGYVLWFADVTMERNYASLLQQQKRLLEDQVDTLARISYTDELTGIGNRRAYEEELDRLRDMGNCQNITAVSIDLNGLKGVNDTIGHRAGDELIQGVAKVMQKVFEPAGGKCYRTGGDEFFALLTGNTDTAALEAALGRETAAWKGLLVAQLSLSAGFIKGSEHPELSSVDELTVAADQAMYADKAAYYKASGIDRRRQ